MPKETGKPGGRGLRGAARSRRDLLARQRSPLSELIEVVVRSPALGWGVVIWGLFILLCGSIAVWARQQPLVAAGRIANETVISRVEFRVPDVRQTEERRTLKRQQTPRVYNTNPSILDGIRSSIENLPRTLAGVEKPEQVIPEVAAQFPGLTPEALTAVKAEAKDGEVSESWKNKAKRLEALLRQHPIVDEVTYQRAAESAATYMDLREDEKPLGEVRADQLLSVKSERLPEVMRQIAAQAGFTGPALDLVTARLTASPRPTFEFDQATTQLRQNAEAAAISPVETTIGKGDTLLRREDVITPERLELYRQELRKFQDQADPWRVWVRAVSVFGAVTAIALAMAGYLIVFAPAVRQSPHRMAMIASLLAAALGVACAGTVINPALIMLTAIAPTIFVAVMLVIGYDRRVALALGALHGVLVCIALGQPIGIYALMLTGVSFAVVQLSEIRDRRGIIRMGLYAAAALALGTVLVALIDRPITRESLVQTFVDAGLAGAGGLMVGVLTLALLPAIERSFDVTTGMTLIELRDPKQPLLRQLQQRAPGTYNHSLNVASIAEAAADAIKADSLLTYVGALYHDIGKMNKPEYFVENQAGGPNKHDKLSPAMSLLVIVGHVKDGMALAEEHRLPPALRHFIEAHHGTTLVEFFYNRARQQAERKGGEEPDLPEEIEYRYPGPKPRTKEAAILMLADAVESATRSMAEPTPSRIDALVRALANKRLMDGQFDECELTLRDLQVIVESISKTVASIYHGRVVYPSGGEERGAAAPERERA
jgi:putative nucleotidyltransferase with HDIG domain